MANTSHASRNIPLDPYSTVRLVPVAQLRRVFQHTQTLAVISLLALFLQAAGLVLLISMAIKAS